MPPRKSDQGSLGDVSAARFVAMDEDTPSPAGAGATTEPEPASIPDAAPHARVDGSSANPRAGGQEEKKDKEKDGEKKEKNEKDAVTIEDLNLPRSIITRLAKGVLPQGTQIQANAVLALSKSATVFVNYLAAHANEHTQNAGKKTISPADVFKAIEDTEFSFLKEPLEAEFAKFQQTNSQKRSSYRQRKRAENTVGAGPDAGAGDNSYMGDVSSVSAPNANDTLMAVDAAESSASAAPARSEQQPRTKKPRVTGDDVALAAAVGAGTSPGVAAGRAAGAEADDVETEPEENADEDTEEQEEEEIEEEGEEEDEDEDEDEDDSDNERNEGEDEEEEANGREDVDEALDGDESD